MGLLYRLAPIVFMGGSLVKHGGQNPIEPAKIGSAILHGPYVSNFTGIYSELNRMHGAATVTDAESLANSLQRLLDRLQQSALKVARIRRVDDDELASIVARAKSAAKRGDLAAARREVEPLSGAARAPLASWIEKVDAREAAIAASRQFASGAIAAQPNPEQ